MVQQSWILLVLLGSAFLMGLLLWLTEKFEQEDRRMERAPKSTKQLRRD
ncbi:hypothetical protein M8997_006490 [Phyllobacterium sp. 21LDTY02-6]|nr:hypothetical protein [Phyllobacterium sp. 21LDTY02-6]MCO4316825.1 hypothetical protein [Phyllobacterium sp. 21LDTY02-6]